ncbi:MAG: response regulator [Magnetococcales bacterium]|nr:response regulator [Magnetococcales bacterium]
MFRPSRFGLGTRLAFMLAACGFLPLVLVTVTGERLVESALLEKSRDQLVSVLELKRIAIQEIFDEHRNQLIMAGEDPDVIDSMKRFSEIFRVEGGQAGGARWEEAFRQLAPWFQRYLRLHDFHDLILIDLEGNVVFSVRGESDLGQNVVTGPLQAGPLGEVYSRGSQTVAVVDFQPYPPSGGGYFAFVATPVREQDRVLGVIVAQFSTERINLVMNRSAGMGTTGESFLIGFHGNVFSFRSDTLSGSSRVGGETRLSAALQAVYGAEGVDVRGIDGHEHLVAYAPVGISGLEWAILATKDLEEIMAPQRGLFVILLVTSLLLASAVAVTALLAARRLAGPLAELAAIATRFGAGEWEARAREGVGREMGQLAVAFNRMADRVVENLWIKTQASRCLELLQKSDDADHLADTLLSFLLPLLEAEHGILHLLHPESGEFRVAGRYRFTPLPEPVLSGEGLVGRCAEECRVLAIDDLAAGRLLLRSGLVAIAPSRLLLVPVAQGNAAVGVLEFAAVDSFSPGGRALLDELAPVIALTLENLRRKNDTEELLRQSRHQAEELGAQTAELEAQTRELEAQTRELIAQREELGRSNAELERQGRELESYQQDLERQQATLEQTNAALEEKHRELTIRTAALEETRTRLEDASRYKSQFLANMSHELRTPLNSLMILAKGLAANEKKNLTPDQVEAATIVHSCGSDLVSLINEILDLAKIEAGRMELVVTEVEPALLVGELRERFRAEAEAKGLAWSVTVADGVPAHLHQDGEKISRVVQNLLANAFKFTREGSVDLEIAPTPPGWRSPVPDFSSREFSPGSRGWRASTGEPAGMVLTVTDTGIGIPQDKLGVIFEAFHQGDGSITRQFGGTGLGLSISRDLARLMGGEVQVTSTVSRGSSFRLFVPELVEVLPETAAGGRGDRSPGPSLPSSPAPPVIPVLAEGPLLLAIEDDPIFSRLLRELAREKGFRCLVGENAESGYALALQHRPVGILLDLGLPDRDGWELLDQLKANPVTRDIPVHILSAREDDGEGAGRGAVSFLTKPLGREEIIELLERIRPASDRRRKSLLLVEDDPHAREVVIRLLADQEVEIVPAASATEALRQLAATRFDGMILDLGLPDLSGLELLDRIRDGYRGERPSVIIYSGRELLPEEYERLKAYTDTIVIKSPRSEERLLDEVVLFLHRLSREHSPTGGAPDRQEGEDAVDLRDKRVLVVDDDVRGAYALANWIESRGMRVKMAANGQKALDILAADPNFDLVLMDVMMPVLDGLEATRRIRAQSCFATLPILSLTAKAMAEDREKCLAAGANDFLSKPVDPDALLARFRVWLNR